MRIKQYGNGNTHIILGGNGFILQPVCNPEPWDKDIKRMERKAKWLS